MFVSMMLSMFGRPLVMEQTADVSNSIPNASTALRAAFGGKLPPENTLSRVQDSCGSSKNAARRG